MKFKDFNFKLLVINELLELKKDAKVAAMKKSYINETSAKYDDYLEGADPKMKKALSKLEIPDDYIGQIKRLYFDIGLVHRQLAPYWSGEDSLYEIKSIAEITQFKNIEKIVLDSPATISRYEEERPDLSPLLKLANLKSVYLSKYDKSWAKKEEDVFKELKAKGVSIVKS